MEIFQLCLAEVDLESLDSSRVEGPRKIVLQLMLLFKRAEKDSEEYIPNYTCGHYQGAA